MFHGNLVPSYKLRKVIIFLNRPNVFPIVFFLFGLFFAGFCTFLKFLYIFLGRFLCAFVFFLPLFIRTPIFRYLGAKEIANYNKEMDQINRLLKEYESITNIKLKTKVVDIDEVNLFINPFTKSLCITKRFLDSIKTFTEKEIKAIIGHEIGHKKRFILEICCSLIFLICIVLLEFGILLYLIYVFPIISFLTTFGLDLQNVLFLFLFILYFTFYFIHFRTSRIMEYKADEVSIKLGNEKQDMISALRKLEKLSISTKKKCNKILKYLDNLLSTHPEIEDRVRRIMVIRFTYRSF